MVRVDILVFGGPPFLKAEVIEAWSCFGVNLVGPLSPSDEMPATHQDQSLGAIIDVELDIDTLIALTDGLDKAFVPSVFATSSLVLPDYRGFELSTNPDAISSILRALLRSYRAH